jgi:hypothetical protein
MQDSANRPTTAARQAATVWDITQGGVFQMTHRWLTRLAASSGLLFVVLADYRMIRGSDPASPDLTSSGQSVVRYAAGHPPGPVWIELLALILLLVFAIVLYGRLRSAEPGPGAVATGVLVGGLLAVSLKIASFPALMVLYSRGGETDPATAYALSASNDYAFMFSLIGQAFMLGAVGVGGLLHGGIPRWLAASGGVVGVALFINAAANLSSGNTFFIGELLFLLWVVVASITLVIRAGAPSPSLARAEVAAARAS